MLLESPLAVCARPRCCRRVLLVLSLFTSVPSWVVKGEQFHPCDPCYFHLYLCWCPFSFLEERVRFLVEHLALGKSMLPFWWVGSFLCFGTLPQFALHPVFKHPSSPIFLDRILAVFFVLSGRFPFSSFSAKVTPTIIFRTRSRSFLVSFCLASHHFPSFTNPLPAMASTPLSANLSLVSLPSLSLLVDMPFSTSFSVAWP